MCPDGALRTASVWPFSQQQHESGREREWARGRKGPASLPEILVAVGKVLVREGLVRLLERDGLTMRVRASTSLKETRGWLHRQRFDVLLLDPEQAAELPQTGARQRTLLVTARDHPGEMPLAGSEAACGMLSESLDAAGTLSLLRTVTTCPIAAFGRQCCGGCQVQRTWDPAELPLSPREREIFLRIGAGAGPRQIATELGLSVKTVESHREKLKLKLGLDGGDALLCAAVRWRQGYRLD